MYLILEIQEIDSGSIATLPVVSCETKEQAESAFYTKCAAAAVSSCLTHTVMLFTHEGLPLDRKYWHHDEPSATE